MGEEARLGLMKPFQKDYALCELVPEHRKDGPALLKEAAVKQGWRVMFMPHGREVFLPNSALRIHFLL